MSDTPQRIQLSRQRGWRMPANAMKVDRSTRWGNPYKVDETRDAAEAVALFDAMIAAMPADERNGYLAPLRNHDLACWCKPGAPCHADVLLKWANASMVITPTTPSALAMAGVVANGFAAADVFPDYLGRKSANTRRRHLADLRSFAAYLGDAGVSVEAEALQQDAGAWRGVTFGLVAGFRRWLLQQGYAVATVNHRLSTVRTYARLAHQAGAIDGDERSKITGVSGYAAREAVNIDKGRAHNRVGAKKSEPVPITLAQARQLKHDHSTAAAGDRDCLIMCLLLDHGLRVSELARLRVTDIDLEANELTFYRPKVDRWTRHSLSSDTRFAVLHYDRPDDGVLLRSIAPYGEWYTHQGMTARAITRRVGELGAAIGLDGLSAHDCRHYCATNMARAGTSIDALMNFFGWTSAATAMRYVAMNDNASDGVKQVF